ncbi:hypothetical protein BX616_006131, partial [Lobosporangium transversale]
MSRRTFGTATVQGAAQQSQAPQKRSWIKTIFAFFPFLALVTGAWLYAFHLDRLANQSMVRAKKNIASDIKSSSRIEQSQSSSTAPSTSNQDGTVIGDSKDNIFYFVQ